MTACYCCAVLLFCTLLLAMFASSSISVDGARLLVPFVFVHMCCYCSFMFLLVCAHFPDLIGLACFRCSDLVAGCLAPPDEEYQFPRDLFRY